MPDTLNAVLEYPEGFTLALGSSFNSSLNSGSGFEVLGTEGSLILRGNSIEVHTTQRREDNGWIVSAWPRALRQAYYEDPEVRRLERRNQTNPPVSGNRSETLSFEGVASTQQHFENFFAVIRSGQQPYEDAARGHRAASCAHLINMSIRRGTPVGWDFATDTMIV